MARAARGGRSMSVSARRRGSVEDAAAAGADIDAALDARITGDVGPDGELVVVVVAARERRALVDRAKDRLLPGDLADQEDGRVGRSAHGLAEPDGVGLFDAGNLDEAGGRVGRTVQAVAGGDPDVTLVARDGGDGAWCALP